MSFNGKQPQQGFHGTENSDSKSSDSSTSSSSVENPIRHLVDLMKTVPTDTPEAELNSKYISDGKGGRIELNERRAKRRRRRSSSVSLRDKVF